MRHKPETSKGEFAPYLKTFQLSDWLAAPCILRRGCSFQHSIIQCKHDAPRLRKMGEACGARAALWIAGAHLEWLRNTGAWAVGCRKLTPQCEEATGSSVALHFKPSCILPQPCALSMQPQKLPTSSVNGPGCHSSTVLENSSTLAFPLSHLFSVLQFYPYFVSEINLGH